MMKFGLAALIFVAGFILFPVASQAAPSQSAERILSRISVQHGGRVKPFATFAKEATLFVTGKASFEGENSTILVWHWIAEPTVWGTKPMIPVSHPELRKRFSSDLVRHRMAPVLILNDLDFIKEVSAVQQKEGKKESLSFLEKKELELYQRARLFEEVAHGRIPGFIPHPGNAKVAWLPLEALMTKEGIDVLEQVFSKSETQTVQANFADLLSHLKTGRLDQLWVSAEQFVVSLNGLLASRDIAIDQTAIDRELLYMKLKPFQLALIFYLLSFLLWRISKGKAKVAIAALVFFISGFLVHAFGFVLRVLISGRAPVTNMYESVIWVSWAVALFALVLWLFYRSSLLPQVAACVAALTLLIGESFPNLLDPSIAPLVPVLRSNYWLTIHVLTITLGYGAFALNWGIAHALLYQLSLRHHKELVNRLTEYLYRSLQIGVLLLASGTILGGVWASYSWGRFWGWDPKETWALIAVLAYLALLHSRTAGWLDSFGVAFWSAVSFLTILMAWYGVNFVLGVGLHSYGFGGGGLPYVLAFVCADVILLLFFRRQFKMKAHHG